MKKWLAPLAALAITFGLGISALILGISSLMAQPAAPFYFPLPTVNQTSLRFDNRFSPVRIEGGCEAERIGTGAVNGWRLSGGTAGSPITLTAFPCTGGDANIGISLVPAGTGSVSFSGTGNTTAHGTYYGAQNYCRSDNTNLISLRVAANDFALARTAAGAETFNINCSLPLPFRTAANKGARVDSLELHYQVLTAALTTHTFTNMVTRTAANNVANAIAQYGGAPTVTLATATQANPYLTVITFAAPVFMNTDDTEVNVEWQAVMQNTGVYRIYGLKVNWTQALY